jgi:hypothetical protein
MAATHFSTTRNKAQSRWLEGEIMVEKEAKAEE